MHLQTYASIIQTCLLMICVTFTYPMHYSSELTQVLNEGPFYPFWVISQVVCNFSELLVLYWTCLSLHKKHIVCFCHHWIGTWQMLASILIPAVSIGFPVTYTVNETLVFKLMLLQLVQFLNFQYYYNCVSCIWHP